MTREIKFRAWDKHDERMIDFDWVAGIFPSLRMSEESSGKAIEDTYVLMQYADLTDKNGKGVYEGDIVRVGKWNAQVVFDSRYIEGDDMLAGYEVLGWWLDTEAENSLSHIYRSCEVIGNVWENPNLLKT